MTAHTSLLETGATDFDPAAALRALRRHADLSQRELAERAQLPLSTVARIESGASPNPGVRTVQRLVAAAGGKIDICPAGRPLPLCPPEPLYEEDLYDKAGRHYPAHLDVRPVNEARDWWGAWWAGWYNLPRHRWPRRAPEHTFDLDRASRDQRRRQRRGKAMVRRLRIIRLDQAKVPRHVWRWTAVDAIGRPVGWVGGLVRRCRFRQIDEFIICELEVVPNWQGLGLGRRLVEALQQALAEASISSARVLLDHWQLPFGFFRACGFGVDHSPRPTWLKLSPRAPVPPGLAWAE